MAKEPKRQQAARKRAPSKAPAANVHAPGEHKQLPLGWIEPSKNNPRRHFDEDKLAELAASIREHGVIEPIVVRPIPGKVSKYELVAGERRLRASKLAKLTAIPAIIRTDVDDTADALRVVENDQRADLTACERADAYRRMLDGGKTVAEIAKTLGRSERTVEQQLSLSKLGPGARVVVDAGVVDTTVAVRAASIPDPDLQAEFLHTVAEKHYTFRQAEELLGRDYQRSLSKASFPTKDPTLLPEAGACSKCPHNTTNMARVADALKVAKNVCTNLACWRRKQDAHWERLQVEASENGLKLLTPKEQEQTFPSTYTYDYLATYSSEFVDLDSILASKEHVGNKAVEVRTLVDEADYANEIYVGRYQSGRVARLVPRSVASKLSDKARRVVRNETAAKKAESGDGKPSEDTQKRHLQNDVRKAAEEIYPRLVETLDEKANGEWPTKYTVLENANMLRAHLIWYLTNFILDSNRRTGAAVVLAKEVFGIDLYSGYTGKGTYVDWLERQRDDVATNLLAASDARLCDLLIRIHTQDSNGRNYDSTKLTPWMLSACALHNVDAPGILSTHLDARQAAYTEAGEKAKARAAKKAGATSTTEPVAPKRHVSRRKAKATKPAAPVTTVDAPPEEPPPYFAPFSRECREKPTPERGTSAGEDLYWRLHEQGFFDPDADEVQAEDAKLDASVAEQEYIDEAGRELDDLEAQLFEALDGDDRADVRQGIEILLGSPSDIAIIADPTGVASIDGLIGRIRDQRAKIDAAYRRGQLAAEESVDESIDETPIAADLEPTDPLAAGKQALEAKLAESAPSKAATPAQVALLADLEKGRECYVVHDTKKGWQAWWAGTDAILPKRTVMPAMDAEWVKPEKGDDPTYNFLAITDAGRDALQAARS